MYNTKDDQKIMDLLKLDTIAHMIAYTSKGILSLQLRSGEKKYQFILDAVPVNEELNTQLRDLYFKPEIVIPQVNQTPIKKVIKKK